MKEMIEDLKAAAADWMETGHGLGYGQAVLDIIAKYQPAIFTDGEGDVWTLRENGQYSMVDPVGFAGLDAIREAYGEQK